MLRTIFPLIFFVWLLPDVQAQDNRFVYVQSEGSQTFYIRSGSKVYSSSDQGYVIVPEVRAGEYAFTLGFPKNRWPSLRYSLSMERQDMGFQLKRIDSSTWALYDILTQELLPPAETSAAPGAGEVQGGDDFTKLLAEVSNNPEVNRIRTEKEPPAAQTSVPVVRPSEPVVSVAPAPQQQPAAVSEPPVQPAPVKKSEEPVSTPVARKASEVLIRQEFSFLDNTGRSLVYTVTEAGKTDKITIFMPYETETRSLAAVFESQPQPAAVVPAVQSPAPTQAPETQVPAAKPSVPAAEPTVTPKACASFAGENDFFTLRRRMAAEETEPRMCELAAEVFRDKCFTTEQIRNLAVLFLKDEYRFRFLAQAYRHCANAAEYGTLESLLTEESNRKRFRDFLP